MGALAGMPAAVVTHARQALEATGVKIARAGALRVALGELGRSLGAQIISLGLALSTAIGAQDNPEIQKIHGYAQRGEAIPWVRVFKVPEFTYFPHKPHVRAGVAHFGSGMLATEPTTV